MTAISVPKNDPTSPNSDRTHLNTLHDVMVFIEGDRSLGKKRKRDLASACVTIAKLSGRHIEDIPASVPELRTISMSLHHIQCGISPKRLANIRSDLKGALECAGIIQQFRRTDHVLMPDWKEFLSNASRRHHAQFLSRFTYFCSARNISPIAVTNDTLDEYYLWLDSCILTNSPSKIRKDTAIAFNAIVKRAHLPNTLVTARSTPRYSVRPLGTYPASFNDDLQRYIQGLKEPDLFSDDGPRRALRPMSLRNIEAHVRQTLNAAVEAGYKPEHFRVMSDLINIKVIKAAVEQLTNARNGETPSGLSNILSTLLAIARYYVHANDETIRALKAANAKVGTRLGINHPRMSKKSQRRMDQFESKANISLLASFPLGLVKKASIQTITKRTHYDMMIAAAVSVLLSVPLRIKNLSQLQFDRDFTVIREHRRQAIIVHISPEQTKGRQAVDAIIEPPSSTVIVRYIDHHRNEITQSLNPYLFPTATGANARTPDHFGTLIKTKIYRETGLTVNPHLFRHFSAYVYLAAHPGAYEDVRRIIGHAKMDTTTGFYAPATNKASFKRYSDVLANTTKGGVSSHER